VETIGGGVFFATKSDLAGFGSDWLCKNDTGVSW